MLLITILLNTTNKPDRMNRILNIICLIGLALIFSRCDGNYLDVEVIGLVSDEISGEPIENATVTVNCWVYDTEIWESKPVEKTTRTDSYGKFNLTFEKGEAIDVEVESDDYKIYQESVTLKKQTNSFDIKLNVKS